MEGDTRSVPLGTGKKGWVAGQNYASTCNQDEEQAKEERRLAAGAGGGYGAGTSRQHFEAAAEVAEAAAEDVEVEKHSKQIEALTSPSKPPAPKKAKKDVDGGFKDQELEFTESQE